MREEEPSEPDAEEDLREEELSEPNVEDEENKELDSQNQAEADETENSDEEIADEEKIEREESEAEKEKIFLQMLASGGSVEVSTHDQFMAALHNSSVDEIVVTKTITLLGDADNGNDQSLKPVMFRGDLTITGKGDANIFFRSPIQLEGDNVTFKDIELNFTSSGALGSVPHREIFLAGHSLTLDNVSCYTKGADGSLGGFGGTEEELLPTIYAGGYKGTSVSRNASLTITNSNDDTDIKAIYAGHDEEQYEMVPYKGDINIEIDARASVREGIYAGKNNGNVNVTVKGNQNTCRIKYFEGNDNTTFTFDNISANRVEVNGGNIVLSNGTVFEPVSKSAPKISNIEVQSGTTLNLAYMLGTVIEGDFIGGGTLILDKDDTLTVNGEISGTTAFKTWSGTLATGGTLVHDRDYIVSTSNNAKGIELDQFYGHDYLLEYNGGVWTAKSNLASLELESFEVLSGPDYVDFDIVAKESLDSSKDPTYKFITESKDKNGSIFHTEAGLYTYVLRKEDIKNPEKNDWATYIQVEELGSWNGSQDYEGKYIIAFDNDGDSVNDKVQPGNYVVFFATTDVGGSNVGEIVNNSVGSAEFTIYKNGGTSSKEIKAENAGAVPSQKYTGREVKPKVDITVDGVKLTEGKDYVLKYKNNINVTTDSAKAEIIVEGIGEYSGSFVLEFDIAKGETETENAVTAEKAEYIYGDIVKLIFTAKPKKDVNSPVTLLAAENKAEFYYGDKLLGTADVVNGKAVLLYDTRRQLVPVGPTDITIKFGGSSQLEAAEFTAPHVFHLQKKKPEPDNIVSISMEDFVYDGSKKASAITDIIWDDPSFEDITFEGIAELGSPNAGSYSTADISSLRFTGKTEDWYDHTPFVGRISDVTISPEVVIRKAPSDGTIFKTLTFNAAENGASLEFDNSIVPDGYEVVSAAEGSESNYGNVVSNVAVTNDKVTFHVSGTDGRGTINVVFKFKNHENISLIINVVKTSKTHVDAGFKINDMEYNGSPYDAWEVGAGYSKDDVTAIYYDIDEQKDLGTTPPVDAGRYSVNLRLETADSFAETSEEFEITKKQVDLKAIDRTINVGDIVPSLDNPQEGVDYEFISGKPSENIGSIKMSYAQVPNTTAAGKYEILIGIPVLFNENYSVNATSGWLTVEADTPVVEYGIRVTGGHADKLKASAGETVTITAEVPQDKEFVRWNTASAGVTIADPESAVTTFTMPANDVEITAEFQEKAKVPVEKIEINRTDVVLNIGSQKMLKAVITPENATNKEVVWSIDGDAAKLVPVDSDSNSVYVEGKKAGTVVVTATSVDGGFTATSNIRIKKKSSSSSSSSESSSGGSAFGSATYSPNVSDSLHGHISVTPKNPKKGDKVTITTSPEMGYMVDRILVTDKNGDIVEVTKDNHNIYTFTQPKGTVNVKAIFQPISGTEEKSEPDLLPFVDVPEDAWYAENVEFAYHNGLMSGVSEMAFDPDGEATRAMLASILYRIDGSPTVEGQSDFVDLNAQWYYDAATWAWKAGIFAGYEDQTFRPDLPITREQLVSIFYNYAKYKGYDLSQTNTLSQFTDEDLVSAWAQNAVAWAVNNGIMAGEGNGILNPKGKATRAEISAMLHRFMENYKSK